MSYDRDLALETIAGIDRLAKAIELTASVLTDIKPKEAISSLAVMVTDETETLRNWIARRFGGDGHGEA
ncbi:hypothetical protein [Zavarzinia aquatilis]|uniref:Uncharacterized protein n=1 Tax=Zavarzinia aquatilis TaxID=2211142 RepID=A0A317EDJ8_9PROT|nr:hypothetical protein [Zavarzinia aquatilis]PWR24210.1 hypothetical protein DKG74_08815 [Zavarzinia aquatilis]